MIEIEVDGVTYEVPSNAADTNWAAKQVAFEQALATTVNSLAGGIEWTAVSVFDNSWANVAAGQPAAYTKDPSGTVYVRGTIGSGSTGNSAFTLPSGYRPDKTLVVLASTDFGMCQIVVTTGGLVVVGADLGAGDPAVSTFLNFNFSTVAT